MELKPKNVQFDARNSAATGKAPSRGRQSQFSSQAKQRRPSQAGSGALKVSLQPRLDPADNEQQQPMGT